MKPKRGRVPMPIAVAPPSSFIHHPSSFLSVSAKKLLNVCVLGLPQTFVSTAKNNVAFTNHHHLTVNQTEPLAFPFKHHFSFFIYYCVLGAEILDIIHFVGDENRGDIFEIPQLHGEFTNGARCWRVEARCRLVEEHNLRITNQRPGNAHSSSH